jgi:hypothetical protein
VTNPSVEVFGVEPTAAQLVVRAERSGPHAVALDGRDIAVEVSHGIGAVVVEDLQPDTSYSLALDGRTAGQLRTLGQPPGRYLGRFATVSDVHVGETGFGHLPRLRLSSDFATAHPVICLRAAVRELQAWGAEALVVKGDLTHDCRAREFDLAGSVLAAFRGSLHVMPGNHDGGNHRHDDGAPVLERHGIKIEWETCGFQAAGIDLVSVNTVRAGHEHGYLPGAEDRVFHLVGRGRPTMVMLHHQLMTTRVPYYLPPGIPHGAAQRFLDRLARLNPALLVTSGHTHRHRRRRHGPIMVTEVGSVKDHPGTWAGYLVYEGGIVQSVHRIMDPVALTWTERTRVNALGAWGRWSPGRLADRSFSHRWPMRPA